MREQGECLVPLSTVKERVGLGKTKIYAEIKAGSFPRCIKNGRKSVWVNSEISNWIEERINLARKK